MPKLVEYGDEVKAKALTGIKKLAATVGSTLGPLGSNVALDRKWGSPSVVHDGVSVAKEIEFDDPFENMGAKLVKEAAGKTNDNSGDGTTTSTILAYDMITEGMNKVKNGVNPMRLRKGMKLASDRLSSELKNKAIKIKPGKATQQIATISAQDEEIGELIAKAVDKMGIEGVIHVEEGSGLDISVEYKEGMEFERGYASRYFVTDQDKEVSEIENPYILVTDHKLKTWNDLLRFFESLVKVSKNIVIIADDIDGDVLPNLVLNRVRGSLNVSAIKAPGFGDNKKNTLADIAVLTGATFIAEDSGRKIDSITVEDLGRALKVVSTRDSSRVVGGQGTKESLKSHIQSIKAQIENSKSDYEREKQQERLAKLTSGVAIVSVGARTEAEMKEKKERVIDAVNSTKAALEEGILPGGATTLIHISNVLDEIKVTNKDVQAGIDLVRGAVVRPFMVLLENSGMTYLDNVGAVTEKGFGYGVDVMDEQVKDMVEAGIVDPAKVVREALDNATAVASTILTTYGWVTDKPEEKDKEQEIGL